jgi:hypothetical protein
MPDVLVMAALEQGPPMPFLVHIKAHDLLVHHAFFNRPCSAGVWICIRLIFTQLTLKQLNANKQRMKEVL